MLKQTLNAIQDPRVWVRIALIFTLGIIIDLFLIGYLVVLKENFSIAKLEAPKAAFEFFTQPLTAVGVLLFGGSNQLEKSIHESYTNGLLQLAFWGLFVFVTFRFFRSRRPEKSAADEYGSHGSARWATAKEIRARFMQDQKGIILGLSMSGKKMIHAINSKLNQLVIVFGGSGSGKSTSLVIPNILHLAEVTNESFIISDPKGEIYNNTAPTLKQKGYEIYAFNILDMKKSFRYNPMDYIESPREARSLAQTIISNTSNPNKKGGDDFWEKAERNLLTALILYVKETRPKEEQHLASVLELGITLGKEVEELEELFNKLPDTSSAKKAFKIFNQSEDRTRAGILIGFGNRLELWADTDVIGLTAISDIDLTAFGDPTRKIALYLMTPTQDSTFNVLPAILIQQAFQELYKKAERMPGNRLASPVRLILDELANIAPIANLKLMMATMRGYGISAFLIFQSKSQFEDRYGRDVAKEIIDSCDTKLLLGTNDLETKKYFSEDLGVTTIQVENMSENKNANSQSTGRSKNFIQRRLMTADEIGRLPTDSLIIMQRANYPVIAKKAWIPEKDLKLIPTTHWIEDLPLRSYRNVPIYIPKPLEQEVKEVKSFKQSFFE